LSKGSAPAAGTPACPWPADQVERWPSDVAVHRWQVFTGRAAGIKLPVNRLSEATIAKETLRWTSAGNSHKLARRQ
jgi:hypothetical protein